MVFQYVWLRKDIKPICLIIIQNIKYSTHFILFVEKYDNLLSGLFTYCNSFILYFRSQRISLSPVNMIVEQIVRPTRKLIFFLTIRRLMERACLESKVVGINKQIRTVLPIAKGHQK